MTIATWKAEFYPIEAEKTEREDALPHSIRKWEGLRPENLAKHGLRIVPSQYGALAEEGYDDEKSIYSGDNPSHSFRMHSGNCSLCHHYMYPYPDSTLGKCKPCPLYQARRGQPCDYARPDEANSPWHAFSFKSDPLPMISWLEKSKAFDPGDVLPNIANYGHYRVTLNDGRRSWTKVDLGILADLLPHGSGLNGSWYVTVAKNGKVTCRSTFSPMNERGDYLTDVEVGAEFTMGAELVLGRVWARRDETLRDYMFELMDEAREKYNTATKADETKVPVGWDKV